MRSIKIEDLPEELYERLIASAARHQRTLQREIIACLESELPALSAEEQGFWHRLEDRIARWRAAGLTPATADEIRRWKHGDTLETD